MLRGCSKFTNLSQSVIRNLPLNPTQFKRYIADKCCPTQASEDAADPAASKPALKNDAFTPPDFVPITAYRELNDPNEVLGPLCGAHKCKDYKNPEYFAYHRFSFYELQNAALELAKNSEGGVLYEAECEESEDEEECGEENSAEAQECEKKEDECEESNEDAAKDC